MQRFDPVSVPGTSTVTVSMQHRWLLSSLSNDMLTFMVGCHFSWQLWEHIHMFFHSHSHGRLGSSDLNFVTQRKMHDQLANISYVSKLLLIHLFWLTLMRSWMDYLKIMMDL